MEKILASANKAMGKKYDIESRGFTLDKTAASVAEILGMKHEDV